MLATGGNQFQWKYTTNPNPASFTSVTPGATNAEGSWTQIASAANLANDVYGILLQVGQGFTSAVAKNHMLDIGVDQAAGTAYAAVVSNLVCGSSPSVSATAPHGGGRYYWFPLYIKAGSTVAVRIQGSHTTAGSVNIRAVFYGRPSRPEMVRVGQYSETIGTITNTLGVSVTPGNTNVEGAWTSLGTTSRALWWWQLGIQCDNAVMAALVYHFDLAYGDGTNQHMIIENQRVYGGTTEVVASDFLMEGYCEVPAGATLYIRGSCSGTTDTGWNAAAIGIGG